MRKQKIFKVLLAGLLLGGCAAPAENASSQAQSACGDEGEFGCEVGTRKDQTEKLTDDFTPISFDEAIQVFENKESALIYFGFPDCPWCMEVVPILHEEAQKQNVPVLYVRTRDDDKELLYTKEQREQIAPDLGEFVKEGLDGELKLYVPLVIAVKDGVLISGHQGTVDDHDAHEREMTEEEKQQVDQDIRKIVSEAAGK